MLALFVVGVSLGVFRTKIQHGDPLVGLVAQASPLVPRGQRDQQIRQELGTFARLAKDLKPSVVNISVIKSVEDPRAIFPFGPGGQAPESSGQGSGVIISPDGDVVTNNHVVEGAKDIRVTLHDGRELKATVVGTDPKTDLALLKVDGTNLPAADLGDSDNLAVGDWVMAIGNPFGLEATVTVGVLSGKGRVIGAGPYDDFLQTDASINPGNSGGPLFNTAGEVVGINTAIIRGGQGIGFSIPINMAKFIVGQLKTEGSVTRGFVGLGIQALTPQLRTGLELPDDLEGALVSSVVPDGPAGRAGAQVEDVVVSLDDRPIKSDRELLDVVARTPVGSTAKLRVFRDGKMKDLTVTIARRPDEQVSARPQADPNSPALGVQVRELTPDIAAQLGTDDTAGVLIVDVVPSTPAARAGLQPGDIVRKVGNHEVDNTGDFITQVHNQKGDMALLIERQGRTVFVVVGS
ncbi:MAG: Do family serine endopeptidase [Candidatus Eremiobacteraeota bacterium]|nr:Do family serine endopeptidase [Candidatus Eremiobacteraeota bacterium]